MLNQDPTLTKEQLQHFGCTDCEKILGLQLSLLQANLLTPFSNNAMASELAALTVLLCHYGLSFTAAAHCVQKPKDDRLHLRAFALQAKDWSSGQNGLENADINYHNLHGCWATVAMRLSCALKSKRKRLHVYFEPAELACLAQILKQKTDLRGLLVYGMSCLHLCVCAYCVPKGSRRLSSLGCPWIQMQ